MHKQPAMWIRPKTDNSCIMNWYCTKRPYAPCVPTACMHACMRASQEPAPSARFLLCACVSTAIPLQNLTTCGCKRQLLGRALRICTTLTDHTPMDAHAYTPLTCRCILLRSQKHSTGQYRTEPKLMTYTHMHNLKDGPRTASSTTARTARRCTSEQTKGLLAHAWMMQLQAAVPVASLCLVLC